MGLLLHQKHKGDFEFSVVSFTIIDKEVEITACRYVVK